MQNEFSTSTAAICVVSLQTNSSRLALVAFKSLHVLFTFTLSAFKASDILASSWITVTSCTPVSRKSVYWERLSRRPQKESIEFWNDFDHWQSTGRRWFRFSTGPGRRVFKLLSRGALYNWLDILLFLGEEVTPVSPPLREKQTDCVAH